MSNPLKQLLPATPYLGKKTNLFEEGLAVHYQEWNRKSSSYQTKEVAVSDEAEAAPIIEHFLICQLLEPCIRFLTGQEQALFRTNKVKFKERLTAIRYSLTDLKRQVEPSNRTCRQVAHYLECGGGKLFSAALSHNPNSDGYEKGQALLAEMRMFLKQHNPAYQSKAIAA